MAQKLGIAEPRTNKEFIEALAQLMQEALEIVDSKNRDYATIADPFRNFRFSEMLNIPVEKAILNRVCDKISRINNIIENGSAVVKDETVKDTIRDVVNYMAILGVYLDWHKDSGGKG